MRWLCVGGVRGVSLPLKQASILHWRRHVSTFGAGTDFALEEACLYLWSSHRFYVGGGSGFVLEACLPLEQAFCVGGGGACLQRHRHSSVPAEASIAF